MKADRDVFGADRGSLHCLLRDDAPDFTAAVHVRDGLAGYGLGRRGSGTDHLGPWMAQNEKVGRQLLEAFLNRSVREMIFVDLVKSDLFASQLLRSTGFEFSRMLTRMYRGLNAHPGKPELLCAILGPEFA